jgi:hypothetical protein
LTSVFGEITAARDVIYRRYPPDSFVGREWLVAEAARFRDDPKRRQLLIVGEPGSGKSAFVAYLAETWNAPRHFVRADHVGGVIGQSVRAAFIGLGAQLFQKYGAGIFDHAAPGVTRVTAGLTRDKAEIVGRLVDELHTLPFLPLHDRDVQVSVVAANGQSRVVGEHIRRLVDISYALDEATLLHAALLAPLHQLSALYPDETAVVLIDALDEAKRGAEVRIQDVIPRAGDADFPSNLRLLMTSRRGDHLAEFADRDQLYLDDRARGYWQASQDDTRRYVRRRLAEPPLADAVRDWAAEEADTFREDLVRYGDGNFLYLQFVLAEAAAAAERGDLRELRVPAELDEIYRAFAIAKIRHPVGDVIRLVFRAPDAAAADPAALTEQARRVCGVISQIDGVEAASITVSGDQASAGELAIVVRAADADRVLMKVLRAVLTSGLDLADDDVAVEKGMSATMWAEKYLPLLGVLAVAFEALSRRRLAAFAGVEQAYVDSILGELGQFVDRTAEAGDPDGEQRFRLYHSSFAEYLLDPARNRDFELDGRTYHDRIADHYRGTAPTWHGVNWDDVPEAYPFQYLAAHLAAADRRDELHDLVAAGDAQQRWAEAQYRRNGTYTPYLEDLRQAWTVNADAGPASLARLARYALIHASLTAMAAHLPAGLVSGLLESGQWTATAAIANAAQLSSESDRAAALEAIAPSLPDSAGPTAARLAASLADPKDRGRAAFALAPYVPEALLFDAWSYGLRAFAVGVVLDHQMVTESRRRLLDLFIPHLLREHARDLTPLRFAEFFTHLLEPVVAGDIGDPAERAVLFGALAAALPAQRVSAALEAVLRVNDAGRRFEALAGLAPRLDAGQAGTALQHIQAQGEAGQAPGLRALAACLPLDQLDSYLARTAYLVDGAGYANVVGAFLRHQPDATLGSTAWRNTLSLGGYLVFTRLLSEVAELPDAVQATVLRTALREVAGGLNPGGVFRALYPGLGQLSPAARDAFVNAALQTVTSMQVLSVNLSGALSFDATQALQIGRDIGDLACVLLDVRRRLPNLGSLLPKAELRSRWAAESERAAAAIDAALRAAPDDLRAAAASAAAEAGVGDLLIAAAVLGLARHVPASFLDRLLARARRLADPFWRVHVLANVVQTLPEQARPAVMWEAVGATHEIAGPDEKAAAWVSLATYLPAAEVAPIIHDALRQLVPVDWGLADSLLLATCLATLPVAEKQRAFGLLFSACWDRIHNPHKLADIDAEAGLPTLCFRQWRQLDMLGPMFRALPAEQKEVLLHVALRLPAETDRVDALAHLDAPFPPQLARTTLTTVLELTDPWQRAHALTYVAPFLPDELRAEAIDAALAAADAVTVSSQRSALSLLDGISRFLDTHGDSSGTARARALIHVARHLPRARRAAVLARVLALYRRIGDGVLLWRLWCRLADHLAADRFAELMTAVRERSAEDPGIWRTLLSLARDVPADVAGEALEAAAGWADPEQRLNVIARAVGHLAADARTRVVNEAFTLLTAAVNNSSDEGRMAPRMMRQLAALLPADLHQEALALSYRIEPEAARANYLRSLAPHLPVTLTDAIIAAALNISDEAKQLLALSRIPDRLPPSLRARLEQHAAQFAEQDANVDQLLALAGQLVEEFDPTRVDPDWERYHLALSDPESAAELRSWLTAGADQWLTDVGQAGRPRLLRELAPIVPVFTLDGTALLNEIFTATRDVARWYP